jgi:hypothetical protein
MRSCRVYGLYFLQQILVILGGEEEQKSALTHAASLYQHLLTNSGEES